MDVLTDRPTPRLTTPLPSLTERPSLVALITQPHPIVFAGTDEDRAAFLYHLAQAAHYGTKLGITPDQLEHAAGFAAGAEQL